MSYKKMTVWDVLVAIAGGVIGVIASILWVLPWLAVPANALAAALGLVGALWLSRWLAGK